MIVLSTIPGFCGAAHYPFEPKKRPITPPEVFWEEHPEEDDGAGHYYTEQAGQNSQ